MVALSVHKQLNHATVVHGNNFPNLTIKQVIELDLVSYTVKLTKTPSVLWLTDVLKLNGI